MSRTVRDAKPETRASRDRLKPRSLPHYKMIVPGKVHLGYRRRRKDAPGRWLVRIYMGNGRYHKAPLGIADDFEDTAAAAESVCNVLGSASIDAGDPEAELQAASCIVAASIWRAKLIGSVIPELAPAEEEDSEEPEEPEGP